MSLRNLLGNVGLGVFLMFAVTIASNAQTATLSGTVLDEKDAAVAGVKLTILNIGTNLQRDVVANESGFFIFSALPPGNYTISAQQTGFNPIEARDIILNGGEDRSVRLRLKVGNITAQVEITAETPLLNESPTVSTVVDRKLVDNLPLNGRTFQSLITLTPGVVVTPTSQNAPGQFSVNGQRGNSNYFTVDGVGANFGVSTTSDPSQTIGGTLPALTTTGSTQSLISVDAMEEFQVQTSTYSAQFGRQPGGQVNIVSRAGKNTFSGSAYNYFRNEKLDANDWFANSRGLPRAALRLNNFGGTFGGPIVKNDTFFFVSYEGQRLRLPQSAITIQVPSLGLRNSAVAIMRPILNAFPRPNGRDFGNGTAEFIASFSNPSEVDSLGIRIDQKINDKVTIFGRYSYAPSNSRNRFGSSLTDSESISRTLTIGSNWAINNNINNDLRFNWSGADGGNVTTTDTFGGAVVPDFSNLLPTGRTLDDSVLIFDFGGSFNQLFLGRDAENRQRQVNVVDKLSVTMGNHELQFGVDYRHLYPFYGPVDYGLNYVFFAPFFIENGLAFPLTTARDPLTIKFDNLSLFADDNWKVNKRLSLNFGVRWEYVPPPTAGDGAVLYAAQNFGTAATINFAPAGTPIWKTRKNNFAPRTGFAYQLTQNEGRETILRGGFGVFYDLGTGLISDLAFNEPNFRFAFGNGPEPLPLSPTLIQRPPVRTNLNGPFFNTAFFDPELRLPYTLQWNVSVQRSLGIKQTITASYVASAGRRLLRRETLPENPNPRFQRVTTTRNGSESDYRSLQFQYQRRLSNNFQALASYTLAKSEDTASEDASADFSTELSAESDRGASSFDVRHNFSAALTYDIPFKSENKFAQAILGGWTASTIIKIQSALPVNVTYRRNIGFGTVTLRPDLVSGQPLYITDSTAPGGKRLNALAFSIPAAQRQGNLERNSLHGFGVKQVDLTLRRQFSFTERIKLQLAADFFNVFNIPNFGPPSGNLGQYFGSLNPDSNFGVSQNMLGRSLGGFGGSGGLNPLFQVGGPRSTQLSLRVLF